MVTRPTLFTPLSAIARLPSGVDFILRTTPPPPGIVQLWNFSVLMSNRTRTFGRIADSTYQIAASDVVCILCREEQHPVRREQWGMRIAHVFRKFVFHDVAGFRVQSADVSL